MDGRMAGAAGGAVNARPQEETALQEIRDRLEYLSGQIGDRAARIKSVANRAFGHPPEPPTGRQARALPNGELDAISEKLDQLQYSLDVLTETAARLEKLV